MRPEKKYMEENYRARLGNARSLVMTEYSTLSAQAINRLRRELSSLPADYVVIKNRIFRRVLTGTDLEALAEKTAQIR